MPILLGPATCVSQALSADETLACCSQDIRICHAGVADWRVTRLPLAVDTNLPRKFSPITFAI